MSQTVWYAKHLFLTIKPNSYASQYSWDIFQDRHMLNHKTYRYKNESIEIISNVYSDHHATKIKLKGKKKPRNNYNIWKLSRSLLSNQWDRKKKSKMTRNKWQWIHEVSECVRYGKSRNTMKIYMSIKIHQEGRAT